MSLANGKSDDDIISEKYKKITQIEHVLLRPGMYIGSVTEDIYDTWVFDIDNKCMIKKNTKFVPGLYKIFDEIAVNSLDQIERLKLEKTDKTNFVKDINITIDRNDNSISITNSGDGLDIVKHPEHNIYIPELVFGNLLTSTNYDENIERTIGGMNGLGSKTVNIFSKKFIVETVDSVRQLHYYQEFSNNMQDKTIPIIKKYKKYPFTKITFIPDYEKFSLTELEDDIVSLFYKRAYDICGLTDVSIKVSLNDEKLPINNFEKYADLYLEGKKKIYEEVNKRWKIIVSHSEKGFEQVSFVNGISTMKGGKHVDHVVTQLTKHLIEALQKKYKDVVFKPQHIKDNLFIFINSTIGNPSFDSQTKDCLTTPYSKFGSKCELSKAFITKLMSTELVERIYESATASGSKLLKKTDGRKQSKIKGIPDLDDANWAGTGKSKECTLILTEGKSAASMAIAGLSVVGRDKYGVFPLRGKILNTLETNEQKIADNVEITALKKIIGLESKKKYKNLNDLRYGSIMIMTDSDVDGCHIKALLFNLFNSMWPTLICQDGFITSMLTPVIKAKNKKQVVQFYNMSDYEDWKETVNQKGWEIKYYKGLGTSTSNEAKDYFREMKQITYIWENEKSQESLDMAFNKKRADNRKDWLYNYDKTNTLDYKETNVNYTDFIDKDVIHFSNYNLERSIPSLCDRFKRSTRKIMFSCFKRNLIKEVRVAQLSGFCSEVSNYHHGEVSLQEAIIGMAQNYVGSNNINLLEPNGQFGCLAPETSILMWNGSIKRADEIKIGDKLVGDDGLERNVLKTTSGEDIMYEIQMNNGEKYIVNSKHILTLKYTRHKKIYWLKSKNKWILYYFNKELNKTNIISSVVTDLVDKEKAFKNILKISDKIDDNNIFDIKLEDYIRLSNSEKKEIFGVKNSTAINWDEKELPIDPYILGLWLGDGGKDAVSFASEDSILVKEWAIYLDKLECEIVHNDEYHFTIRKKESGRILKCIGDINNNSENCNACQKSKKIMDSCDWSFNRTLLDINVKHYNINGILNVNMNPFRALIRKNNLYKNKHIPNDYIYNSKENRLKLLAGFIDTDGNLKYYKGTPGIKISQSDRLHGHMIDSLKIICDSLGFNTKISYDKINLLTANGSSGKEKILYISGIGLDKIPTKIDRKIIKEYKHKYDPTIHSIIVKPIGLNKFNGWQVDSNERFLLGNYVITHNSRLHGGDDHASSRYINTLLNPITSIIFNKADNNVINYLDEDGCKIEPEFYMPIIPMLLVNGSTGIGTGFSTNIPCHNPQSIVNVLKKMLKAKTSDIETDDLIPWYQGFKGKIVKDKGKLMSVGIYTRLTSSRIEITELPIGVWTQDYKEFLEKMLEKEPKILRDYESHYTESTVHFILDFHPGVVNTLLEMDTTCGLTKFEKLFKLSSSKNFSTSNMHIYNEKGTIIKCATALEIIKLFYNVRIVYYQKRKDFLIDQLENELIYLDARIKFILDIIEDRLQVSNQKRSVIEEYLKKMLYPLMDNKYEYLIKMPIYNLTYEKKEEFMNEIKNKKEMLENIKSTSIEQMWLNDLTDFEKGYKIFINSTKA